MDWQDLWVYYLIAFFTVALVAGANLWAWKRQRDWRWRRDGVASLVILAVMFAILYPTIPPRAGWYARNMVLALTFSPDGRLLALQTRSGDVTLREAATGRDLRRFRLAEAPPMWPRPAYATELARLDFRHSVVFSPDGRLLAGGWQSVRVRVWDTTTGLLTKELDAERPAQPLAFTPDGEMLLVGDYVGHVNAWRTSSPGRDVVHSTTVAPVSAGPSDMAFAPNGLLTVIAAAEVQQWDPKGWRKVHTHAWKAPFGARGVAPYPPAPSVFSPDGRWLALQTSGSAHTGKNAVYAIWDTLAWKLVRQAPLPAEAGSAALSPNGRLMATGGENGITLLDTTSGRPTRAVPSPGFYPLCFAFSTDGQALAVGGEDRVVKVLSLAELTKAR
jgi:WD40 repeat protein